MLAATGYGKESETSTSSSVQLSQQCRHFKLFDILLATENFDESLVIGRGGFGKVYRGIINNGSATVVAAIKRLDPNSNQGAPEFWAEVEMLSELRHCNLVSLFGYCNHEKEMILVYEYMPNGSLEDHLHKLGTPLSWVQRLKICIGAGRGLHYLHTGTGIDVGVIHRDVKTSNILLQESWAAKISDFGLSKRGPTNQPITYVSTLVKGTFGYFDPDYYATGKLSRKSDVYAFGVVLLEVLCRKRAVFDIDEEPSNLANWVQESIKEGSLKNIIDFDIRGQISPKCLKEFVRITERCLHSSPKRSTMAEVLLSLEPVLILQEKFNNSVQPAGRTILDRIFNMLPFPSNRDNTAQGESKPSSEGKSRIGTNNLGAGNSTFQDTLELPANYEARSFKEFYYDDLKKATKHFSPDMLLGEGGFGKVYLGWVDQNTFSHSKHGVGVPVAVKRLSQESMQGSEEWQAEVSFLGRLAHPNIISLVGYCSNSWDGCSSEQELLLVYEYMANKSLDGSLFRHRANAPNNAEPLSWGTRLTIMTGVARGLVYLHSSQNQVIHRDLKCSNILLDKEFTAKLADFGLAKSSSKIGESYVSTRVLGTYGYAAPEYISTGHLYVKSDIYSFGVVLLETLTGLRVVDINRPTERQNLIDWARLALGELRKIIDPCLEGRYPLEGAFKYTALALRCLENNPKDRPSSEEVLKSLEDIYAANWK